jgi:TPP-dependent pyruvate/acetoin dehydrogenase alpha subunit
MLLITSESPVFINKSAGLTLKSSYMQLRVFADRMLAMRRHRRSGMFCNSGRGHEAKSVYAFQISLSNYA